MPLPKIRVAAYCRVSTEKDDQISSLDMQKKFFEDYSRQNNYELTELYTDEGISGTKLKNRVAFNRMMADAKRGKFSIVFVKDISRFARNAVDFLQSIRELKAQGIQCRFVNSNLSTEDGEFTLGILALMAQEESSNISKRVKFGKTKNAMNGKVPNLVYGYDKTPGNLFTLSINNDEASIVKRIFNMYTQSNYGANKIAQLLNEEGFLTKRQCKWSQNAVSRILSNPIYIGNIVNGKEEIEDFLTGKRHKRDKKSWYISNNPNLSIISNEEFFKAQEILSQRHSAFKISGKRESNKHLFSTLIQCKNCGYSFRRINIKRSASQYIKWVCSRKNSHGVEFCTNNTKIDELELEEIIRQYLISLINDKNQFVINTQSELKRQLEENSDCCSLKKAKKELERLKRAKAKQTQMFESDIISLNELKERADTLNKSIEKYKQVLSSSKPSDNDVLLKTITEKHCKNVNSIISSQFLNNILLKKIIDYIQVSDNGEIEIFFKESL